MIFSINQSNLEDLFLESKGNKKLFKEIFSRKCGKTSSITRLAQKYNGFYVGKSREVCKLAERNNPNLKTYSVNQLLNYGQIEGMEFGSVLFVDEIDYDEVERIKQISPHVKIFGFVNNLRPISFHEIFLTEQYIGETDSQFSINNKKMITEIYEKDNLRTILWKRTS